MQYELSLHQGQPGLALVQLQDQIRKDPGNPKLRVFLFQLLVVLGQWERSLTQLKVAGDLDASNLLMVQTYREAIQCEVLRAEVFLGKRSPLIFGDPQQWLALLVEALRLDATGQAKDAQALRNQSFEAAPAIAGTLNGVDFEWIADADSRIGPVLESVVNGKYYWIPFQQVSKIEIEEPVDLRDLVWIPAQFTWINGGGSSGLIPTRYPGSESSQDPLIQMARKTEWEEIEDGAYRGFGQRILSTSTEEYSLLDIRLIELKAEAG